MVRRDCEGLVSTRPVDRIAINPRPVTADNVEPIGVEMAKDGKDYEKFVKKLQQALLDSEDIIKQKNIMIEANKKLIDNCGLEREFDLYWEYDLGGVVYKTIIECKDYSAPVSVEKIDALIGKIRDLPDLKPVFATRVGYQSGAKTKALQNKIDLLIVRGQRDEDWFDEEGTPYLKVVNIKILAHSAARVTKFNPLVDGEWVKNNTDIDISKPLRMQERNDQVTIVDVARNDSYSVLKLEERLAAEHAANPGEYSKSLEFEDAYLCYNDLRLKLRSLSIEYVVPEPISLPLTIDFSKELVGVIEYLHRDSKTVIFADKIVRDW